MVPAERGRFGGGFPGHLDWSGRPCRQQLPPTAQLLREAERRARPMPGATTPMAMTTLMVVLALMAVMTLAHRPLASWVSEHQLQRVAFWASITIAGVAASREVGPGGSRETWQAAGTRERRSVRGPGAPCQLRNPGGTRS
jgi:hypothetical protein